jgi:hypothetical protein
MYNSGKGGYNMSNLTVILIGCAGGLLPDLLRIIKNRHQPDLPPYLKSLNFYIGLICQIIVGGITALLLQASSLIQALAIGFSGPEFLTKLLSSQAGAMDRGGVDYVDRGEQKISLRDWFSR